MKFVDLKLMNALGLHLEIRRIQLIPFIGAVWENEEVQRILERSQFCERVHFHG